MIYRALRSFSGVISMAAGEERELKDQYLIDDLLKAGYILPVREAGEDRGPLGDDNQPHAGPLKATKKGGKKK